MQSSETKGTLIHQGRITYLSGIFQLLLPAILLKLKAAATHGIKGADWDTPSTNDLGIKSIQYSSVLTGFEMKSKQQLAEERRTRQHIITIGDKPRKVYDGILDTHADEHVAQYMQRQLNSTYTMIVNLSSRTEFFGGNVLVDKGEIDERSTPDGDASSDDEPEAKYNNADILLKFQKQPDHPEFNALKTKYQRYTPEQGSVLLIRSECSHGIHKVTKGKMNMLILEFWPYADALTGSHFQPAEETGPPQMNEEL